jgi:outer membrane protein OmpA-like peptidoglycan-associated protein
VRDAERQRAQAELLTAQQQLAEARRQRAAAEQLARQGATQEEVARLQAEAERQRQEAERIQGDVQRQQQDAARQAEAQRQQQEEQQRRVEAEAQARQLAQQLEQERQARQDAERRAAEQVEAERRARAEAEQRATLALNALQGVKVREEARGTVVTLSGSVLFASGKAELLPASANRLEEVARALQKAESPIVVEGHTDARGTEALNEELSRQRAEAVRGFLVSRGVPADRIEARGLGEYRPVANNTSAEGRANNRRVEIILPRNVATGGPRTGGTGGAGNESANPPAPQHEAPPDPASQPDDPLAPPGGGDGR